MDILSRPVASFYGSEYILNSTTDFTDPGNDEIEFYRDTKYRIVAINAANPRYRKKWAGAETTFGGVTTTNDISITTLTERDGASTFRLFVNGVEVESFINSENDWNVQPISHT